MTKEELKQEAEEYGIDNFEQCMYDDVKGWETDCKARVQAYIDGAKPREKRIADLEKENAELKSLRDVADLIRLNNSHIVAMAQLHNNNVALRKENAELKNKLNKIERKCKFNFVDLLHDVENESKQEEQLTKAKELLKDITLSYGSTEVSEAQLYLKIKKAEQFLSEVEK